MTRFSSKWFGAAAAALVIVFSAPASGVRAGDGTTVEQGLCAKTMQRLQKRYSHFTTLEAHFKHALKATALNQDEVEEGTVYMERGGLMRWDYSRPKGKLAVADGRNTYLYLPSENQVYIQPFPKGQKAPFALRLLTGDVVLGREVECTRAYAMGKTVVLALSLKNDDQGIRDLEIACDPSRDVITEVYYKDGLGNQISLTLTNITFPKALDPALFRFHAPEGARVIRGR